MGLESIGYLRALIDKVTKEKFTFDVNWKETFLNLVRRLDD